MQGFKGIGLHPVVAVEEEHVLAGGGSESGVAGGAEAPVGLCDDSEPHVALGIVIEDGGAAVGAAVVDADGFPVGECLSQHAVEALPQVGLYVVDGYDDGEPWHLDGVNQLLQVFGVLLQLVKFHVPPLRRFQFLNDVVGESFTQCACRIPDHDGVWLDVFGDNGSGTNDGPVADVVAAGQYDSILPNPHIVSDG